MREVGTNIIDSMAEATPGGAQKDSIERINNLEVAVSKR
jgi:hypothetical protein